MQMNVSIRHVNKQHVILEIARSTIAAVNTASYNTYSSLLNKHSTSTVAVDKNKCSLESKMTN